MGKKSLVIYAIEIIISVIITIVATVLDAYFRKNLLSGRAGFPLRFSSSSFFGGGTTNYAIFAVDVAFWFVLLIALIKVIQKILKKHQ